MKAITTIPPYAPYLDKVANHPAVSGFRLNTVMPLKGTLEEELTRMKNIAGSKPLWIDLKCRQVRTTNYASTPYHHLEISHELELSEELTPDKPLLAYFNDGYDVATIAKVDGKKLIMLDGPQRVVGPGESLNIMDSRVKIKGYFTQTDKDYIEAAKKVGIHTYMLSYVEQESDITDLLKRDPQASIVAKIESPKGIEFAKTVYKKYNKDVRLMAARGDLYVEVGRPHKIIPALKDIIKADPKAIVASRLFGSLRNEPVPSCPDITDVGFLAEIGYRNYMIGDAVCFKEESLMGSLNLFSAIAHQYRPKNSQKQKKFLAGSGRKKKFSSKGKV